MGVLKKSFQTPGSVCLRGLSFPFGLLTVSPYPSVCLGMSSCTSAGALTKQRPSFTCLRMELESILGHLSVLSTSQDPLYINLERAEEPAEGGRLELPGRDQASGGAGDGSGVGAMGGTPSDYRYILSPGGLAEQPAQEEQQPESPVSEGQRLLLLQQGLLPHSSC